MYVTKYIHIYVCMCERGKFIATRFCKIFIVFTSNFFLHFISFFLINFCCYHLIILINSTKFNAKKTLVCLYIFYVLRVFKFSTRFLYFVLTWLFVCFVFYKIYKIIFFIYFLIIIYFYFRIFFFKFLFIIFFSL